MQTEQAGHFLRLHLKVQDSRLVCPHCDRRALSRQGRRHRELQTVPVGLLPVYLRAEVPDCACRDCGARFEVAPFAPAYRRLTHRLMEFVQTLAQVMCSASVAGLTGLSWDTVKDLFKARPERDSGRPPLKGLRHLLHR